MSHCPIKKPVFNGLPHLCVTLNQNWNRGMVRTQIKTTHLEVESVLSPHSNLIISSVLYSTQGSHLCFFKSTVDFIDFINDPY